MSYAGRRRDHYRLPLPKRKAMPKMVTTGQADTYEDLGEDVLEDPDLLVARAMNGLYRQGTLAQFLTEILRTGVRPKYRDEFVQHLRALGLDWNGMDDRIQVAGTSPDQQEASNNGKDVTDDFIARPPGKGEGKNTRKDPSKRVFLVHGKDEKNTRILKEMLIQWGLEPKIMIEEPHMGRTLIEKLIDLGSGVGYVFVLMTSDDVGIGVKELTELQKGFESETGHHPANAKELASFLRRRARQNVIFEYGMFMGQLGRKKVCLLKKGDVDFPTDLLGLGYIPFEEEVSEQECREQIERELRRAGYELKSQKVIWDVGSSSSSQVSVRGREVSDEDLPPEIRSEVEGLRKSPRTISNVRVFRDTNGTYTIQYDEI